ncbi:MAG: sn-glycerol-3-phosphate ABC transporter ATP-binding protein UgpC [Candidatus Competibacter sp.]
MADIRMRSVCKAFKDVRVIERVNLDIEDGEFAVFVGPSGCGKSTLLRLVAGLEDITSGEMTIGGKQVNNIPPSQRGVAMVFQSYALYPHMTIFDNMAFGLKLAKEDSGEIKDRVHWAAKILQMEHLLERLPKELSGGQRQRVAIGRAIVRKPGVFLFDEPLSNLDAALRVQTRIEISKLHHNLGASMIYVTHDQVEAMTLADKIVLLNAGKAVIEEGSVAQIGPPLELYHHPVNLFVAGFIGSPKMNFLSGQLAGVENGVAAVTLPDGTVVRAAVDASSAQPGQAVTLGIRPEHVALGDGSGNSVRGEVAYVEHLGESSFIYSQVQGAANHVIVRQEGDTHAKMSDRLTLALAPQHCHLFDEKGRAFRRRIEAVAETMPVLQ